MRCGSDAPGSGAREALDARDAVDVRTMSTAPFATRARLAAVAAVLCATLTACGSESAAPGTGSCAPNVRYPDAIGCAYVYGKVTDARGVALDSIDGLVRLDDACRCSSPRLEGDENGVYATVIHRLPRSGGFADTATATIVAQASAPKYPRHVTGAAYFDTLRIVLHFVPMGASPPPTEANLRIPIPGR